MNVQETSSSRGRIISSLRFNMMIDHLCPPALPKNSDEGGENHACQSSSWSHQNIDNMVLGHWLFSLLKIHTWGSPPLCP